MRRPLCARLSAALLSLVTSFAFAATCSQYAAAFEGDVAGPYVTVPINLMATVVVRDAGVHGHLFELIVRSEENADARSPQTGSIAFASNSAFSANQNLDLGTTAQGIEGNHIVRLDPAAALEPPNWFVAQGQAAPGDMAPTSLYIVPAEGEVSFYWTEDRVNGYIDVRGAALSDRTLQAKYSVSIDGAIASRFAC